MYLGVDFGQKRIGLAVSSSGKLAREDRAVNTTGQVARRAKELGVKFVIIGLPLNADGSPSPQSRKIKKFADNLTQALPPNTKIIFENEFLSTFEAEEQLRLQGITFADVKKRLDMRSAKIILEQYLSNRKKQGG